MSAGDTEWKTALGTSAMMMMTLLEQEIRQNSGTQLLFMVSLSINLTFPKTLRWNNVMADLVAVHQSRANYDALDGCLHSRMGVFTTLKSWQP